jgi:hypothetical protein
MQISHKMIKVQMLKKYGKILKINIYFIGTRPKHGVEQIC